MNDRTERIVHVSAPGHVVHHTYEMTWKASGNVTLSDPHCGSRRWGGRRNVAGAQRVDWCAKPACKAMQTRCTECSAVS